MACTAITRLFWQTADRLVFPSVVADRGNALNHRMILQFLPHALKCVVRKLLFLALCVIFLVVYKNIPGTAARICAKFTR